MQSPTFLTFPKGPTFLARTPRPPKWTCAGPRKRARRKKPVRAPPTQSKRTILTAPLTFPTRLESIAPRGKGPSASQVRQALRSRRDVIITGTGTMGKISATLSARERSESALVLLPTREEALRAALEASHDARGAKIIVAAGLGHGSFRNAAQNANSYVKSVVVVGTVRGVFRAFLKDGHGPPWLAGVGFLVVGGLEDVLAERCEREFRKLVNKIPGVTKRKNVIMVKDDPKGALKRFVGGLVRENVETIRWESEGGGSADADADVEDSEEGWIAPRGVDGVVSELEEVVRGGGRVVVFFQAGRLAELYAEIVRGRGVEVVDVHNGSSIGRRERALEMIHKGDSVIFGSDFLVNATLPKLDRIVQVGYVDEEKYKKRTGLLKKGGQSLVITAGYESMCVEKELGIEMRGEVKGELVQVTVPDVVEKTRKVGYVSWLKFYMTVKKRLGWSKEDVVKFGNEWAMGTIGEIPRLDKRTVNHLMLRDIEGIRME